MQDVRRSRSIIPVAAVVAAALAAVVAGAVVAQDATADRKRLTHQERRQVKKIAKKIAQKQARRLADTQITKRESSLNVNSARTADSANTAERANTASTADAATTADGVVDGAITASALGPIVTRVETSTPVAIGDTAEVDATCEPGERLIGGAGSWQMDDRAGLTLVESRPATAAGGDPPTAGPFRRGTPRGRTCRSCPAAGCRRGRSACNELPLYVEVGGGERRDGGSQFVKIGR